MEGDADPYGFGNVIGSTHLQRLNPHSHCPTQTPQNVRSWF